MTESIENREPKSVPVGATVFFWTLILISVLVLACAFAMCFRLWGLPKFPGALQYVRLLQASILTYGIGIGLFGSAVALYAPEHQRRFGTAATVHGFGFMVLSFGARTYIEHGAVQTAPSKLPLILPAAILAASFVLFINGWSNRRPRPDNEQTSQEAPTGEQPRPLSLP